MPAVLNNTYCSSCGGWHKVCFPGDDIIYSSREYEYDCPSTRRAVRVPKGESCEVTTACPKDALIVREVKS